MKKTLRFINYIGEWVLAIIGLIIIVPWIYYRRIKDYFIK